MSTIPNSQDAFVPDSRPSSPEPEVGDDEMQIDHSRDPTPPSPPSEAGESAQMPTAEGSGQSLSSGGSISDLEPDDWDTRMQMVSSLDIEPSIARKVKKLTSHAKASSRHSRARKGPDLNASTSISAGLDKGKGKQREKRDSSASGSRKRTASILQRESRTPDESGESSSGVEVTSARAKPLHLKPRSRSLSGTPLEDRGEGPSKASPKIITSRTTRQSKSQARPARQTRSSNANQSTDVPLRPAPNGPAIGETFVPMSTGTEALDADDIIARLRAKTMARLGQVSVAPAIAAAAPETSADSQAAIDGAMDDDSDDDLADPSVLLKRATTRTAPPVQPVSIVKEPERKPFSRPKVRLPADRSKYSLASLARARKAETSRGWRGVSGVETDDSMAEEANSTMDANGEASYARDTNSDASDLPEIPTSKGATSRARSGSDGALKRVAGALGPQDEALKVVVSAKEDVKSLNAQRTAEDQLESRRFWDSSSDMLIQASVIFKGFHQQRLRLPLQPYKPYEVSGRTGLAKMLCQNVLGELVAMRETFFLM